MTGGTRPWASVYPAMPPIRRKKPLTKLELDNMNDSLDTAIDLNWRQAAQEAMERILKNHYCPVMPATATATATATAVFYERPAPKLRSNTPEEK